MSGCDAHLPIRSPQAGAVPQGKPNPAQQCRAPQKEIAERRETDQPNGILLVIHQARILQNRCQTNDRRRYKDDPEKGHQSAPRLPALCWFYC
jgi:hypothetical protein